MRMVITIAASLLVSGLVATIVAVTVLALWPSPNECIEDAWRVYLPVARKATDELADMELPEPPDIISGTELQYRQYQREYDQYTNDFDSLNRQLYDAQDRLFDDLEAC